MIAYHDGGGQNMASRSMTSKVRIRIFALASASVLALPGCANSISSTELTGFGTAAALLGRQTDVNFAEANRIARLAAVDRFVQSGAIGLTEAPFAPAVPAEVAMEWRAAFSSLERYGLLLGTLTADDQRNRRPPRSKI